MNIKLSEPSILNVDHKIFLRTYPEKDKLLTAAGKATLDNRYLLEGETYQDMFARVAKTYADNEQHAERLYEYFSSHWAIPATPVLSNGGTNRGLPISCFLNETDDSLEGIINLWTESAWLAASGGGVGSYWGNLRSMGERIKSGGRTSGIIPFIAVEDRLSIAVSQGGSLRRGSIATFLPISHPEIREFMQIRKPTGGDPNRKTLNIHHGVTVDDEFMQAVESGEKFALRSPFDRSVIEEVDARDLWITLLTSRIETGEPYIIFTDNVNRQRPEIYKKLGLEVKTSNLCSEIMLATGKDHRGKSRTAVCCLSSVNLEYYDEWAGNSEFIYDMMCFIDNVLEDFIQRAPDVMERARYSAARERSVGIGVMGLFSYFQRKSIASESLEARAVNLEIFKYLKIETDEASRKLAALKGPNPDALEAMLLAKERGESTYDLEHRFTHRMAIAPTASISIIAGNTSPGIEPFLGNSYTQKTLVGSYPQRNKYLKMLLAERGKDNDVSWATIVAHEGSVQALPFLTAHEKAVFKTAHEMDQHVLIDMAAERGPYICQGQSLNVFLPADVNKTLLHKLHFAAWKKGVKSMYYCRSKSLQRAEKVSSDAIGGFSPCDGEVCHSCG